MRVHAKICNAEARLEVAQFAHESGRSVPKYTERNGLCKTFLSARFVEAARVGGGQPFVYPEPARVNTAQPDQLALRGLDDTRAEAAAAFCLPCMAPPGFALNPSSSFSTLRVLMTSFFSIHPRRAICTP